MCALRFVVGYDSDRFREYYKTLDDLHAYYKDRGSVDETFNELGDDEERHILSNPSHLIVWSIGGRIVGHCIWHETSTDEHSPGYPREKEERDILSALLGGRNDRVVELHELWLKTEHRGKGYGKRFFTFFETFARQKLFEAILYYTDCPAAVALCRSRGYRESFLTSNRWFLFVLPL